jgi:hypothetical protein
VKLHWQDKVIVSAVVLGLMADAAFIAGWW